MLHVCNIHKYRPHKWPKCRSIFHTWSIWERYFDWPNSFAEASNQPHVASLLSTSSRSWMASLRPHNQKGEQIHPELLFPIYGKISPNRQWKVWKHVRIQGWPSHPTSASRSAHLRSSRDDRPNNRLSDMEPLVTHVEARMIRYAFHCLKMVTVPSMFLLLITRFQILGSLHCTMSMMRINQTLGNSGPTIAVYVLFRLEPSSIRDVSS